MAENPITFDSPTLYNQTPDLSVWHIPIIEESLGKKNQKRHLLARLYRRCL